jgi:hypothetical protein
MKTKDVTKTLKTLGWTTGSDEVGDRFAHFQLPDRLIEVIYGVESHSNRQTQKLIAMASVSTNQFSEICMKICEKLDNYTHITGAHPSLSFSVPEIFEEHVRQMSDNAIAWAQDQDLERALAEYAALPTSAPGSGPVKHLAALVLRGDIAKLKSYQASFEAGDRLGFVPYITKDYIDRAVAAAEEMAS